MGETVTRARAVADGVLVDVTACARATGFNCPVAFTRAAFAEVCDCTPYELVTGHTVGRRVLEALAIVRDTIKTGGARDFLAPCCLAVARSAGAVSVHRLQLIGHPDEFGQGCLTIALERE